MTNQTPIAKAIATLTPKAHARLSPSGAKRWMACPGSLTLTAGIPDKSTSYSDDGTAIHEVSAQCLSTQHHYAHAHIGEYIVVSAPGQPVRKVQFTQEMADLAQGYVDFVSMKALGFDLRVEQRLEFSKFVGEPPARAPGTLPKGTITAQIQVEDPPGSGNWETRTVGIEDPGADGQFGTTDAGFVDWDAGEIIVDDLKSGHTPVEVERNPQLLTYALAFLGQLYEEYMAAGAGNAADWVQRKFFAHPEGVHDKKPQEAVDDDPIW